MSRLQLPQISVPRSPHLVLLEKEFEGLNSFYWLYRSSSSLMMMESVNHAKTTDFVPQPEASRLDLRCSELPLIRLQADRVARYGILVQVITYYEVYLASMLADVVSSRWPANRQATIKLRPSELPAGDLREYIKRKTIEAEVGSVIDESYSKRLSRVANILKNCGFMEPVPNPARQALVTSACEVRNCIVHNGGKVDQKTYEEIKLLFPNVALGDQLELEESDLWKLVGAVRDDARAIDYAIRKQASDRRVRKAAKRRRAAARRKAENLRQMTMRRSNVTSTT
jgi:hypothetical protein